MSQTTQTICSFALSHLFDRFLQQLKINKLLTIMPDYLAHTLCQASIQTVFLEAIPLPKNDSIGPEDAGATNIALDINSTFSINCEQTLPKANDGNIQVQTKSIFNRTKSKRRQNSIAKPKPEQKSELFALSEPIVTPKQVELEDELELVKKNLYFMRRLRKEYEEEQKRRLEQIFNRKALELPATEFAFDFSGELIQRSKPNFKKHLAIPTTAKSQDVTQPNTQEKVIDNNTNYSDREFLISRGLNASPSREGKRLLFGNQGKRQISHLPFIKLNDNIKLSEGPRSFKGPDSQRYTLKSYQSRGETNFRSFSEIEKERSDRLYSLKRSSRQTEYVQDEIEQKQVSFATPKKQSKRMQKYLKKLCEDRYKNNVDEINRSCNFDRINSPHDYSVHRYYKHNFDQDKRSICELSLASIKLQSSRFFQESTQLE